MRASSSPTKRSLARERIRTVDLSGDPLQRMFGLVKRQHRHRRGRRDQRAGQSSQTLVLDPVTRDEAEPAAGRCCSTARADADGAEAGVRTLASSEPGLAAVRAAVVLDVPQWPAPRSAACSRCSTGSAARALAGRLHPRRRRTPGRHPDAAAVRRGVRPRRHGWPCWRSPSRSWWNYRLEREPGGTLARPARPADHPVGQHRGAARPRRRDRRAARRPAPPARPASTSSPPGCATTPKSEAVDHAAARRRRWRCAWPRRRGGGRRRPSRRPAAPAPTGGADPAAALGPGR